MASVLDELLSRYVNEYQTTMAREWHSSAYKDPASIPPNEPVELIRRIKHLEARLRQLELVQKIQRLERHDGAAVVPAALLNELDALNRQVEGWTELPTPKPES